MVPYLVPKLHDLKGRRKVMFYLAKPNCNYNNSISGKASEEGLTDKGGDGKGC